MRFDTILARLTPTASYTFKTITEQRLSKKLGDTDFVLRDEQIPVYDSYAAIIWNDVIKQPTPVECEDEWLVIQKEETNEGIDEKRIAEYLSIGEQFDMQYWDIINGTTLWVDHVTKVKTDNPKL